MPYDLKIENPFVLENGNFIVYSSSSLKIFSEKTFNELNLNKNRILDFFGISEFRKVTVILLDDLQYFREYVLSLRGKEGFLPTYARGVFDKGMIIECPEPNLVINSFEFNFWAKNSIHELSHIINYEKIYKKNLIWLDEGIANNLDGTYSNLNDDNNFKWFILNNILTIKELPILNALEHRKNFKTDTYNGYNLAYLCVRYLIETMDKSEFQRMIRDYDVSIKIGETVLKEAIDYYMEKLNLEPRMTI